MVRPASARRSFVSSIGLTDFAAHRGGRVGFVLQRQVALVPAGSHKNGSVQLCCDSLSSPAASLAHTAPPAPPRERDSAAIQSQCAQSPPLPEARSPTDCDCGPPAGTWLPSLASRGPQMSTTSTAPRWRFIIAQLRTLRSSMSSLHTFAQSLHLRPTPTTPMKYAVAPRCFPADVLAETGSADCGLRRARLPGNIG